MLISLRLDFLKQICSVFNDCICGMEIQSSNLLRKSNISEIIAERVIRNVNSDGQHWAQETVQRQTKFKKKEKTKQTSNRKTHKK